MISLKNPMRLFHTRITSNLVNVYLKMILVQTLEASFYSKVRLLWAKKSFSIYTNTRKKLRTISIRPSGIAIFVMRLTLMKLIRLSMNSIMKIKVSVTGLTSSLKTAMFTPICLCNWIEKALMRAYLQRSNRLLILSKRSVNSSLTS